jgi:hypothetical protein
VIFALSLEGLRPPAPKPLNAPAAQFSAARALDALRRILGNDVPHPVGSAANDAVRDRVVAELARIGYQPQIQTAFACSDFGECGTVNNILARLDGTEDVTGPPVAVLLASHYDSVPAGPGDSDDGTGVAAVLETARALKSLSPPPRHPIIFLIDDGEEAGLLGARAFVDSHLWAKDVRAAVNVDARGTSGPSLMFETGAANEWAVHLYARSAAHAVTSSIFYTAYQQLPNDTDFTVFKAAGYQGLNFAFVGDEVHYHTPLDNSANVNPATLQHQGENALAGVVALANSDLSAPPQREAVYFDLFGRVMLHWQARRTLRFAILSVFLLLLQTAWMIYKKRLALREFSWGFFGWLMTALVTGVLAIVLRLLIRSAGGAPVNWTAHPLPIEIAFWSLAVAVVVTLAVSFSRRAGFWGLWTGVWIGWGLLALTFAWQVPGLSYVVLVPVGVAALAGLPATMGRGESVAVPGLSAILPLAAAGIVGFPPAVLLYEGLGNRGLPLIALVVGLILTPVAPLCADLPAVAGLRGLAFIWIPILTTALASFAAVVMPAYSAKAPERVNIEYWKDADSGRARWIVEPDSGRLPEPIRLAAAFRRAGQDAFPWDVRPSFLADAPSLSLSAPTFTVLESGQTGGRRTYKTLLRSERGAPSAAVLFPPDSDVENVRIEGQPVAPEIPRIRRYLNGWAAYRCPAMPPSGFEIDFSLPDGKPVEVWVADRTYELPPDGAFLLKARPLTAAPSQDGDVAIVTRRVELIP